MGQIAARVACQILSKAAARHSAGAKIFLRKFISGLEPGHFCKNSNSRKLKTQGKTQTQAKKASKTQAKHNTKL